MQKNNMYFGWYLTIPDKGFIDVIPEEVFNSSIFLQGFLFIRGDACDYLILDNSEFCTKLNGQQKVLDVSFASNNVFTTPLPYKCVMLRDQFAVGHLSKYVKGEVELLVGILVF